MGVLVFSACLARNMLASLWICAQEKRKFERKDGGNVWREVYVAHKNISDISSFW
jgi:hypothetical protein